MADKKAYCGIKKLTKAQRRGTIDECKNVRQIRYWGIESIHKKKDKPKKDKPKKEKKKEPKKDKPKKEKKKEPKKDKPKPPKKKAPVLNKPKSHSPKGDIVALKGRPPKKKAPVLNKPKKKSVLEEQMKDMSMNTKEKQRLRLIMKLTGIKGSMKKFSVQYERAKKQYIKSNDDEWKEKMDSYKKSFDKNIKELDVIVEKIKILDGKMKGQPKKAPKKAPKKTPHTPKGDIVAPKRLPKKEQPKKELPKTPKKECNITMADFKDIEKLKNIKFPCTIGKGKTPYYDYDQLKEYMDTKILMAQGMGHNVGEELFTKMRANIVKADNADPPDLELEPEEIELQKGIINMFDLVNVYENVYLQLDFDDFDKSDKIFYGFLVRDKKTSPFAIINELKPNYKELLKKGQLEDVLTMSQECKIYTQSINSLYNARNFLIKNGASIDKLKLNKPSKGLDKYLKRKCKSSWSNPWK
jgi:hypothetical protein